MNLAQGSFHGAAGTGIDGARQVTKLNEDEAAAIDQMLGRPARSLEDFCRAYTREFGWQSVCVTRGEKGCVMLVDGEYVEAGRLRRAANDTVGAGDAFAAAFIHGLSLNWPAAENCRLCQSRRRPCRQPARWHSALDARRSQGPFKIVKPASIPAEGEAVFGLKLNASRQTAKFAFRTPY